MEKLKIKEIWARVQKKVMILIEKHYSDAELRTFNLEEYVNKLQPYIF